MFRGFGSIIAFICTIVWCSNNIRWMPSLFWFCISTTSAILLLNHKYSLCCCGFCHCHGCRTKDALPNWSPAQQRSPENSLRPGFGRWSGGFERRSMVETELSMIPLPVRWCKVELYLLSCIYRGATDRLHGCINRFECWTWRLKRRQDSHTEHLKRIVSSNLICPDKIRFSRSLLQCPESIFTFPHWITFSQIQETKDWWHGIHSLMSAFWRDVIVDVVWSFQFAINTNSKQKLRSSQHNL